MVKLVISIGHNCLESTKLIRPVICSPLQHVAQFKLPQLNVVFESWEIIKIRLEVV